MSPLRVTVAVLAMVACDAPRYDVSVRFDPSSLADRAVRVEVAVVGSCEGQTLGAPASAPILSVDVVRMGETPPLGDLEPGSYGLYARAIDTECRVFAAGCAPIEVVSGGTGMLVVTVTSTSEIGACPSGVACNAGSCGGDGGIACTCAPCADCTAAGCTPDHARCGGDEYCDVMNGCTAGVACADSEPRCADDGDPCTMERCDTARSLCVVDPATDGDACSAGGIDGQCRSGSCCTGCWNGARCEAGRSLDVCGAGGAICEACDDLNECTDDACGATGCTNDPDDTNTCTGGTCHAASCCTGCWDGTSCQAGDTPSACGVSGGSCITCTCPLNGCGATGACEPAHPASRVGADVNHTCAVTEDGLLFCWGNNEFGQLGLGDVGLGTERVSPTRVGTESDWSAVSCGEEHCCGIRATDQLWCWGANTDGQLGQNDYIARQLPTRVPGAWSEVWCREDRVFARATDGTVRVAGENDDGDLGIGGVADATTFTPLSPPSGATSWTRIGLGYEHSCGVDSLARMWCWGQNTDLQIGSDTMLADQLTPLQVGTDMDWMEVSGGNIHTCAIRTDRTLWCWGSNHNRQIDGALSSSVDHLPTRSGTASNWAIVAAGEDHTCGIDTSGQLFCWGENEFGQIGAGVVNPSLGMHTRVGTGSDWESLGLGQDHSCGIRSDGLLYCWGRNDLGQLGLGDRTQQPAPTAVCFPQ